MSDQAFGSFTRVWDISVKDRPGMHSYPGDPQLEMTRIRAIARGDTVNLTHLSLGAHTGTHVDAPAHFIDDGATLEQMPLECMLGTATVLDLRGLAAIDRTALERHDIPERGIVLFKTDNSALWAAPAFQEGFTYLTRDAAELLAAQRTKTIGLDYLSIEQFGSATFEVHKLVLGAGMLVVEGLDLGAVDAGVYFFACLPMNLQGVDGAPARAVLMR